MFLLTLPFHESATLEMCFQTIILNSHIIYRCTAPESIYIKSWIMVTISFIEEVLGLGSGLGSGLSDAFRVRQTLSP
jgi:hypothetical protein